MGQRTRFGMDICKRVIISGGVCVYLSVEIVTGETGESGRGCLFWVG